jgi:hypothetical protein
MKLTFQTRFLSHCVRSATRHHLLVALTALEGFLQALRHQKLASGGVGYVTFLAILGPVFCAWLISIDEEKSSIFCQSQPLIRLACLSLDRLFRLSLIQLINLPSFTEYLALKALFQGRTGLAQYLQSCYEYDRIHWIRVDSSEVVSFWFIGTESRRARTV